MQWLGTDVLQHALPPDFASSTIGPTFLATRLACWDIREGGPDVVVSDMRFRHEHAALQRRAEQLGARYLAIRLVRPTTTTTLGALEACHVSETESVPHHIVVLNDGTLQDLYRKIDDHVCAAPGPPTR
jgi:hypothetical protein